ncbi:hypothetical protein Val02_49870 [Virgisporangium aliadipatigenens]|uniref:CBS domain-containing protein n=1 Tax=Virgisporangium aliadipatigenens TaxID=741659 RepID=A0A8J4DSE9_9ACTN|nr:BON domain-containing protein [Virgisporangium aliadipatigenens]GIJ48101.1 hypothetical protein Val02_49870 [Virgisporangium aliadipatigenens]
MDALTVADLMHRRAEADTDPVPAMAVSPRDSVRTAVCLMRSGHVERLRVLDDGGGEVGVITWRDVAAAANRSDADIRRDITDEVLPVMLGRHADEVRADVHHRVVVLLGAVEERVVGERIAHAVEHVDGVLSVVNAMAYRRDTIAPRSATGHRVCDPPWYP